MVVDTSALIAILFGEPERERFLELLAESDILLLSVANALEASVVVESRRGSAAGRELDLFIHRTKITMVSVDAEHFSVARQAWRNSGRVPMQQP